MTFAQQKYPFLEYLYAGDPEAVQDALFGSALRALGKGWSVGIISENDLWMQLSQRLQSSSLFPLRSFSESTQERQLLLVDDPEMADFEAIRHDSTILGKTHIMLTNTHLSDQELLDISDIDLLSVFRSTHHFPSPGGQLFAITGNGKGKTTSALGKAFQLSPQGRVGVVQWFKEPASGRLTWDINEHAFPEKLTEKNWEFHATGAGFFGSPALDRVKGEDASKIHQEKAQEGLKLAHTLLDEKVDVLVLDELFDTLPEVMPSLPAPLLEASEVEALLRQAQRENIPTIVTGRSVPEKFRAFFAVTTEIQAARHPWADQKRGAVSGLDF